MQPSRLFKKRALTTAVQAVCYSMLLNSSVQAEPTGGAVVGGSGTINQSGLATTIHQASQNLAINWQTFNVAANERVQFIQPNSTSVALNRILSNNGSTIAGRIDANGRVMLVNPNGVFFTSTAVLNVGSIIASGLDIKPSDFMNGNYIFDEIPGSSGAVINNGMINASLGGNVALIGKHVENNGLIVANLGTVTLAAGKQAVLTFDSGGLLGVRVSQEILQSELGVDPAVINSGTITAQGGRVLLTASQSQDVFSRAVNTTGMEPATSVVVHDDGTFTLGGGADVLNTGRIDTSTTTPNQNAGRIVLIGENVTSSGALRADAQSDNGGEVELHARDTTLLTQNSVISARSESNGNGGIVKVLGDKVGLFDQSIVDVSGANGGGQALVGGDYQGKNTNIRNASRTYVSTGSTLRADALQQGHGGRIINWGNDYTWFYGNAFARGGSTGGNGGNGGFVEISGKGLSFDGSVDTSATNGLTGTLLFDPTNIIILAGGATPNIRLNDANAATILNNSPATTGTFTVNQDDLESLAFATSINFVATNDITINDLNNNLLELRTGSGNSVTFRADSDSSGAGAFSMNTGNTLRTNGGSVTIHGATVTTGNINTTGPTGATTGGDIQITAGNGNINVEALTTRHNATNSTGNITLAATGVTAGATTRGDIILNAAVATNGGNFSATTAGANAGHFDNSGGGASINTGSGSVTINTAGNDGGGIGANLGRIAAGSLNVTTSGGRITQSTTAARNLAIAGTSTFNANGAIDLQNPANNLQGAVALAATGNATLINNATTTTLGTVNVGGILTVTADRHLTLNGNVAAGTMNLFFGDGGLDSTFTTSPGIAFTAGAVSVVGGGGDDTFNLNSLFTGAVNGNGGANTLRGPDAASTNQNDWLVNGPNGGTFAQSGTNAPATGTVSFADIQNLTGGSGVDTFTVQAGAYVSGYIDGGGAPSPAMDSVNLSALVGGTTAQLLTSAPAPTDTFNNTANQFTLYRIGSVTANADNNTLRLVGTASPNQWAITGTNSGSANGTTFTGFNQLIGDTGVDIFTFSASGTLNDASGRVLGRIDGGGGPGVNTLTVNGASGSAIILGQGNFSVGGSTQVGYANIADVTANGGASIAVNNTNIAGTLTLANTGSVTSAGLTAGTLVLNGVGQFGTSTQALNTTIGGLSVLNSGPVYLNNSSTGTLTLGSIATASLIDITAAGAVGNNGALVSSAPLTIRSAGGVSMTNAGNALTDIRVTSQAGNVTLVNNGTLTASITTLGNINLTNNGNLIIDRLYTNGGNYLPLPSGPYTGDVRLAVNGGGIVASRANTTNGPDIVANNLTVRLPNGGFGTSTRPMSLRVHDTFSYLGGRGYWQPYGADPRVFDDVNRSLSRFSTLSNFNLQLLEVESLNEFDPAIFTEIRNYYYEDVAILMPADQGIDAADEEEKEAKGEEKP